MHLLCVNVKRHTDHRLIKWDACPRNHKLQNDQKTKLITQGRGRYNTGYKVGTGWILVWCPV